MPCPTLIVALALLCSPGDPAATYIGRQGQLQVRVPRVETDTPSVVIDGTLDEAVVATGGACSPASRSSRRSTACRPPTRRRYCSGIRRTALYVGIRAFEAHGAVHATLADRDKISADDNVQLLLGTFHDQRQAYVFAVNPLGVQMDGTLVESGQRRERRLDADARRAAPRRI